MKRIRNESVIDAWSRDSAAINHKGTLRTDGAKLWSYELLIGDTCVETSLKVLKDYTARGAHGFRSQTTSCHVGLARQKADVVS